MGASNNVGLGCRLLLHFHMKLKLCELGNGGSSSSSGGGGVQAIMVALDADFFFIFT
jgi:hypothetical protein